MSHLDWMLLVTGFRQNSGLTTLLDLCDLQHIVLTGLRSGLVLSLVLACCIHFTACFDVCLWSLSYWKAQLCWSFNCLAHSLRLYWGILRYFIIPFTSFTGSKRAPEHDAEMLYSWYNVSLYLWPLWPNNSICLLSDHKTFLQKPFYLSVWLAANCS